MKSTKINRIIASVLCLAITTLLFINPNSALAMSKISEKIADAKSEKKDQSTLKTTVSKGIKAQDGAKEFSREDLESMRSALLILVDSVEQLPKLGAALALAGGKADNFKTGKTFDELGDAKSQIEKMSNEELLTYRKAFDPSKMVTKLEGARAVISEFNSQYKKSSRPTNNSNDFPEASGTCGDYNEGIPTGVLIAADVVYFVAETVRDLAQDACDQVAVVAGFGANTSLACIATDIIYVIAHAVNQGLHFCDDDLTGAIIEANYERLEHLHSDLEDVKANDTTNTKNIIANDNENRTGIEKNDDENRAGIEKNDDDNTATILEAVTTAKKEILADALANKNQILADAKANKEELRLLILRTQIEADLASESSSVKVASYMLPTARGGYLDMVQQIVTETLAKIRAAGGSVGTAQTYLDKANADKAAGNFKSAYDNYRKAYKAAVA